VPAALKSFHFITIKDIACVNEREIGYKSATEHKMNEESEYKMMEIMQK